jgi:hypothetical protein
MCQKLGIAVNRDIHQLGVQVVFGNGSLYLDTGGILGMSVGSPSLSEQGKDISRKQCQDWLCKLANICCHKLCPLS